MQLVEDKIYNKKDKIIGALWGAVLGDVIGAYL